jgi:polysaccharide biosynthesis protein PslH
MKVLHLSPGLPWPPDSGGRIVIWNQLRADARHAQVGLISFVDSPPDAVTLGALHATCALVKTVRRPRTLDGAVGGVRSLLSSTAMNLAKYRWSAFTETLRAAVAGWQPDIVVAHHLHMGGYLLDIRGPVPILREHNVDSDLMERYAVTLRNPALAGLARRQAELIRATEERLCPRVARCLMITPDDETRLKQLVPNAITAVVPGAVNAAEYTPVELPAAGDPPLFVTAGSLGFRPTGEGVVEFVEETWPLIRRKQGRAVFRIIGACPETLRKRLLKAPGVEMTGRVDQVRPHLTRAHAFVVPLRVGSGMRIRILEAMAFALPIVSTPIGCEGIAVEDGRHLLVVHSPEEMAEALLGLARDDSRAHTLRREGRRLVEKSYSVDAVEQITARIYRKVLESEAAGAA